MKHCFTVFILAFVFISPCFTQVHIGGWSFHLPYGNTIAVADAGEEVYCANSSSIFIFHKPDNSYERLSTVTGMADIGIKNIIYSEEQNTLVISYTNSNVDFIIDDVIVNFPFIKTGNVSGDKNIYDAAFFEDTIILACGFGLVLFDTKKRESPATYFFTNADGSTIRVNSVTVLDSYIYAATLNGVYRGSLANPLEDFGYWEFLSDSVTLPEGEAKQIREFNNEVYALIMDTIYLYNGTGWNIYYYEPGWHTVDLNSVNEHLLITQQFGTSLPADSSQILIIDTANVLWIIESTSGLPYPNQSTIDDNGLVWIADGYRGLTSTDGTNYYYHTPNGPGSTNTFDLDTDKGRVWVAARSINSAWH